MLSNYNLDTSASSFLCLDVRLRMQSREGCRGLETGLLSLSVPFPLASAWQRAFESLKPWLKSRLGARLFPCSEFSDTMRRAERPPSPAAKCSQCLTLTTCRVRWNVVQRQVPMPATTGIIIFPWKFPLMFVICLWSLWVMLSHTGQKKKKKIFW